MLNSVAVPAIREDMKAQMIKVSLTSNLCDVRTCFRKNPTKVDKNTIPTAAQSPVNRRQKAAFAHEASNKTRYLLAGGVLIISLNLFLASERDILSSAMLQLRRLKCVLMSKLIGIGCVAII